MTKPGVSAKWLTEEDKPTTTSWDKPQFGKTGRKRAMAGTVASESEVTVRASKQRRGTTEEEQSTCAATMTTTQAGASPATATALQSLDTILEQNGDRDATRRVNDFLNSGTDLAEDPPIAFSWNDSALTAMLHRINNDGGQVRLAELAGVNAQTTVHQLRLALVNYLRDGVEGALHNVIGDGAAFQPCTMEQFGDIRSNCKELCTEPYIQAIAAPQPNVAAMWPIGGVYRATPSTVVDRMVVRQSCNSRRAGAVPLWR